MHEENFTRSCLRSDEEGSVKEEEDMRRISKEEVMCGKKGRLRKEWRGLRGLHASLFKCLFHHLRESV